MHIKKQVPAHHAVRFRKYKSHRVKFNAKGFKVDTSAIDDMLTELESSNPQHADRVKLLIGQLLDYPKCDRIDHLLPGSYNYEGFSIPEHTHKIERLSCSIFETWSKDIDATNRLLYKIRTKTIDNEESHIIEVVSIEGHDYDDKIKFESYVFVEK